MRWLFGAFLLFQGFCLLSPAQELPVQVVDERGEPLTTIQVWLQRGDHYFQVSDLFRLFDRHGRKRYIPLTRRLTLQLRGKRFDFTIGRRNASVEGRSIRLSQPPLSQGDVASPNGAMFWVPSEVLTRYVGPSLGYSVDFNPSAQRLQLRATQQAVPLDLSSPGGEMSARLIIDPGHGGQDLGVHVGDRLEKEIALSIARQILTHAQAHGLSAALTRDEDRMVPSLERAQIAMRHRGELFLSIHCNASFSQETRGVRIYVNDVRGELQAFEPASVDVGKDALTTQGDRGIQEVSQRRFRDESQRFAALLKTTLESMGDLPEPPEVVSLPLAPVQQVMMPAILLEVGFLTNADDAARLVAPEATDVLAEAIVNAALQFLGQTAGVTPEQN